MIRHILLLAMILPTLLHSAEFPLFAFENGVRFSNHKDRASLLAEIGYDGIGSARLPGEGGTEALFAPYEARGLKVFSFYTGLTVGEEGVSTPNELLRCIPELKGRDVVIELFIKGRRDQERDEEVVAAIHEVAQLAEKSGLEIVLYPHAGMYVETLADALRLAKKVNRKNVGTMFNLCHFLRVEPENDLEKTLLSAGTLLRRVSISGADTDGNGWPSLIQPLGEGTYDVRSFLNLLHQIGFEGPVGLQCYNIKGKSEEFLNKSMKAWQKIEASL